MAQFHLIWLCFAPIFLEVDFFRNPLLPENMVTAFDPHFKSNKK